MVKENKKVVEGTETVSEPIAEKSALEIQMESLTKLTEGLVSQMKEKDEEIKNLMDMADSGRKEKIDAKKRLKIVPRVKVTKLNGKVVVKSRTIIDTVYKDLQDNGKWVEKQIHNYTLEDGSTIDMALPEYTRVRELAEADVTAIKEIPEKESEFGEKFYQYTVKLLEDGRELTLDYQYIN